MKRYIASFLMVVMLAVAVPMLSGTAQAQVYNPYGSRSRVSRIYDRHRQAVNIGGGALAGALLGALLGGKKGALIGTAVGVAGGAIATRKQAPRNYYRY
jgi:uncharacterized membrane protein YebE (DUF533 family)